MECRGGRKMWSKSEHPAWVLAHSVSHRICILEHSMCSFWLNSPFKPPSIPTGTRPEHLWHSLTFPTQSPRAILVCYSSFRCPFFLPLLLPPWLCWKSCIQTHAPECFQPCSICPLEVFLFGWVAHDMALLFALLKVILWNIKKPLVVVRWIERDNG